MMTPCVGDAACVCERAEIPWTDGRSGDDPARVDARYVLLNKERGDGVNKTFEGDTREPAAP